MLIAIIYCSGVGMTIYGPIGVSDTEYHSHRGRTVQGTRQLPIAASVLPLYQTGANLRSIGHNDVVRFCAQGTLEPTIDRIVREAFVFPFNVDNRSERTDIIKHLLAKPFVGEDAWLRYALFHARTDSRYDGGIVLVRYEPCAIVASPMSLRSA
jgi:hypothetical protein